MSLSTDTLLFGLVLVLISLQTALPVTEGGRNFLFAGLGIAVIAWVGSVTVTMMRWRPGVTDGESAAR